MTIESAKITNLMNIILHYAEIKRPENLRLPLRCNGWNIYIFMIDKAY